MYIFERNYTYTSLQRDTIILFRIILVWILEHKLYMCLNSKQFLIETSNTKKANNMKALL